MRFLRHLGPRRSGGARALLLGLSLVLATAPLASSDVIAAIAAKKGPKGVWLDHTKRGAIEIYDCGRSLCGRVVWMKNPLQPSGEPVRDHRNAKKALRNRPICGMQMIGGLRRNTARTWSGGWIYDPERGQKFKLKVTQRGADRLTITGFLLTPAFGRSHAWTRASDETRRCAEVLKAAKGDN